MAKLSSWIIAAAIAAAAAAVSLRDGAQQADAADYSRTPILFVHGHGLSSNDWRPLIAYLARRGYPPEYLSALDIRPSRMANIEAAEAFIAPAVESLLRQAASAADQAGHGRRFERVDILAHSMGAVSSRWYATRLRPDRVRTWIAIAGANHGTNALCNHSDPGAAEMCPAYARSAADSRVQAMLNGVPGAAVDESPYGVGRDPGGIDRIPPDADRSIHYLTVRVEPDEWIIPGESATLAGAGGVTVDIPSASDIRETSPGNFRTYRDLDHMTILDDPAVHRLCFELLSLAPVDR